MIVGRLSIVGRTRRETISYAYIKIEILQDIWSDLRDPYLKENEIFVLNVWII